MKALADYVHLKGLKPGIYSSPGAKTCAKLQKVDAPLGIGHCAQLLVHMRF
jgi:hypothetical protein